MSAATKYMSHSGTQISVSEILIEPVSAADWSKYSEEFRLCYEAMECFEGGFSNRSTDLGGATKWGISQKAFPDEDIRGMTRERAVYLAHEKYWKRIAGDSISEVSVAAEIFDTAYNMGFVTAIRIAQEVCVWFGEKLVRDGKIGPKTLRALNKLSDKYREQLIYALNGEQYIRYKGLVSSNYDLHAPNFKGWMRRLNPSIVVEQRLKKPTTELSAPLTESASSDASASNADRTNRSNAASTPKRLASAQAKQAGG